MKLTITDANIFIDLFELDLIDYLFSIGLDVHTSQDVLEELFDEQIEILTKFVKVGTLKILILTPPDYAEIAKMKVNRGFSEADKTLLFLCEKHNMLLLSGEKLMRSHCNKHNLEIHGILWLLDEFLKAGCINHTLAFSSLSELLIFNPRLPLKECNRRLGAWEKGENI